MKTALGVIVSIVLVLAVIFGLNLFGFAQYSFFAPRMEAVRRDTMLQSRAYHEGNYRELYRLKLQYTQAKSDEERATIKSFALHEADAMDRSQLPLDLQAFLVSLGG
jgi:hypothetical protein